MQSNVLQLEFDQKTAGQVLESLAERLLKLERLREDEVDEDSFADAKNDALALRPLYVHVRQQAIQTQYVDEPRHCSTLRWRRVGWKSRAPRVFGVRESSSTKVSTVRVNAETHSACGQHPFAASLKLCYTASMRPGKTKTTSFSLDAATLSALKALARRRHKGNVSALLAEFATREAKFAAAEAFFERYAIPPLDDEAAAQIEAEWRGERPKRRRRRAS